MPREIEAKYKVASFAAVEKALRLAGAKFLGTNNQTDQFFDTLAGGLRLADKGLRLRIAKPACGGKVCAEPARPMLTFKGPGDKKSSLKIRMEIQTHLDSAAAIAEILRQLGYRADIVVRKRRSSYRLGDCMVELDQLPQLGRFVEVEGPSQRAVRVVCRQLGLVGESITRPYVAMVAGLKKKPAR
jgi:adenylate cyclase class 2